MSDNKKKIFTPISILLAILYIISFIFAKEEKIQLVFILAITLSIVIVSFYIKNDDVENINNYKRDIYILVGYFILYYSITIVNSLYHFTDKDYINFILFLIIPYFGARLLGYKLTDLGLTIKNTKKTLTLSIISIAVVTILLSTITFKQYIADNNISIMGGLLHTF